MAKITPSHFCFIPRSRTYIGPPAISPVLVLTRYFTERTASEYFVAMPKTPVNHIQSTVPGPPAAIAVATPTMLPVPMVAANAVVNAPNWLTSPCPSCDLLHGKFDGLADVSLDEAKPEREENMRAEQKNQQRRSPNKIAELSDKFFKFLHKTPCLRGKNYRVVVRMAREKMPPRKETWRNCSNLRH